MYFHLRRYVNIYTSIASKFYDDDRRTYGVLIRDFKKQFFFFVISVLQILYLGVTLQEVCDFLEKNNVSTYPIRYDTQTIISL